jgi:Protein of unknown function (DUF2591)
MKTAELTGIALDRAVAHALGAPDDGNGLPYYSTDWALGGPIIEQEGITIVPHSTENGVIKEWKAGRDWPLPHFPFYWGSTPLVAAMRCYVASKLGDEVEIPEELT